jgi:hypothetical protein
MLDELTDSLKAKLYDFTVSPLLITFIASWIGWNYRFVLVVLSSSMSIYEKTSYIESRLFSTWTDYVIWGIVGPLLTTGFLLFVYPYPAKWVFKFWRQRQRELKELKQQIDGETPLTKEESAAIRERNTEVETLLVEKDRIIDDLRGVARKYRDQNVAAETLKSASGSLIDSTSEGLRTKPVTLLVPADNNTDAPASLGVVEEKILDLIGQAENRKEWLRRDHLEDAIVGTKIADRTRTRFAFDRLIGRNWIMDDEGVVSLLSDGRAHLVALQDQKSSTGNPSPFTQTKS